MKKLCLKLLCLALPFVLYFGAFVYFEPYDYFGLKGGAQNEDSVITRVRSYLNAPEDSILLGDSRMAHFDLDLVAQVTGRPWSNLAFGGASMNESIDLFYLAAQRNPNLKECVFEVSFYTLRQGDARNRMQAIETVVENPVAYLFNFNYNADMLNNALLILSGGTPGATRDEGHWTDADWTDENGGALPHRRNLIGYAATLYGGGGLAKPGVLPATETAVDAAGNEFVANPRALLDALSRVTEADSAYAVNEENLQKLVELAAYCQAHGIKLTFVLPPVDDVLRQYLLTPLGITKELARIKQTLADTGAPVLDFEYEPLAAFTEDQYYDGFHLDVVHGLPQYTKILFEEVTS